MLGPECGGALRVLIIDVHSVYRAGLRSVFAEKMPGAEVFEAHSLADGLAKISLIEPSGLALIDLDLPSVRSLDVLKRAFEAHPRTRFAILSASDSRENILASLAAGFHGFISKHQFDGDILDAISDIASGRIYVPPLLARAENTHLPDLNGEESLPAIASGGDILRLTPRQREVLSHLALGKSNKEIGRALHIAEATTKVHAAALLRALGARNRTAAAFKAGRLLESFDRSPPLSPNSTPASIVREDERMLKLRLMEARAPDERAKSRLKGKPSLT
jgi:DNA-binding NarL/FixJ family response regulator